MMYRKLPLFSVALLSAAFFWACNDEPDPKTMAKTDAPAKVETPKPEHAKLKAKVRVL